MRSETWLQSTRAWLSVIDGALSGIERTAWSAREAWGTTSSALRQTRATGGEAPGLPTTGIVRLTRTGFTLAQIAASYRLHRLQSAFVSRRKAERKLARLHERNAERFYETCIEHGGAFVKVGQVLSARADLLPEPFVAELSQLQDALPAVPFALLRAELSRTFGAPLEQVFASIDETPLAAASIGQVHRATTRDGHSVAVKVQRPGIAKLVRADLALLERFLQGLRSSLPPLDYDAIVSELQSAVLAELDYRAEAEMTETIGAALRGEPQVVVPRVVAELSGDAVLTTTFIEGRKLTRALDELAERGEHAELSRLLGVLLSAYLRQILVLGAFQADPHPGNLLVTPDGKLAILDFGCSKTLEPETRRSYVQLFRAIVHGERERMAELFAELGFETQSGRPDTLHTFADALLSEFREALTEGQFRWPEREQMFARASAVLHASEHDPVVRVPQHFVLIARVLGTLGGLFAHYRPSLAFVEHVLPVLGEAGW